MTTTLLAVDVTCPVCRREGSELLSPNGLDVEVLGLVGSNTPGWSLEQGLCRDCHKRFSDAFDYLSRHDLLKSDRSPILPTPLRLGASERYRGRGVTIAFLDSGFYAHPDLVEPGDRILRYVDLVSSLGLRRRADLKTPDGSSWHGMMTSVVACGNGTLSNGFYRGIASEAKLVLIKVGNMSRVAHEDIRRGIDWVIRNRKRYGIDILNVSCGGDFEASYLDDSISQAAERATREGILVCAAVGNQGLAPNHPVLPPASAPAVLTVGGLDDKNRLAFAGYDMYHSSYGPTVDGLQKPEVIAPGIFVAAPILPGTPTADQADLLTRLDRAKDAEVKAIVGEMKGVDPEIDAAATANPAMLRLLVRAKIRDNNVISGSYKHVDGTSFAAPIVASVAAQMIEANRELKPLQLKRLLVKTARRIPTVNVDRQGWGVVDPRAAVEAAEQLKEGAKAPGRPGSGVLTRTAR